MIIALKNKQRVHKLKIHEQYFEMKIHGDKPWEIRNNDRNYQIGDLLELCEIDDKGNYTGRSIMQSVDILISDNMVMLPNHVILQGRVFESI